MAGPLGWAGAAGAGAGAGAEDDVTVDEVVVAGAGAWTSAEIRLSTCVETASIDWASVEDRRPCRTSRCTCPRSLAAAAWAPLGLLAAAAARTALTSSRRVAESWAASGAGADGPPHPAITTPAASAHARAVLIWDKRLPGSCRSKSYADGPVTVLLRSGEPSVDGSAPRAATCEPATSGFHEYAYWGSSCSRQSDVKRSGRKVSHMTASSSVHLAPKAFSTAPDCGPCGRPEGCRVTPRTGPLVEAAAEG